MSANRNHDPYVASIAQLISKLKQQIVEKKKNMVGAQASVLAAASKQLDEYKNSLDSTQSWDLFLAIKEIVKMTSASTT
jgi:hypothetical protein